MFVKTTKVLLLISLLAIAISQMLNNFNSPKVFAQYWYYSVLFFFLTSILINYILYNSPTDPKTFIIKIMATCMMRLLLCMFGFLIYNVVFKSSTMSFALHFVLHYILFTIFEIAYLLKYTNAQKTQKS
jgi:hypothetical protein